MPGDGTPGASPGAGTMQAMLVLAAKVWHYWISIPLVVGAVGLLLALLVGYIVRVVAPRYPRR